MCIIAVMEIAVGEYNVDVNKIIKVALKKYYEDTGKSIISDTENNVGQVYRPTTVCKYSFFCMKIFISFKINLRKHRN